MILSIKKGMRGFSEKSTETILGVWMINTTQVVLYGSVQTDKKSNRIVFYNPSELSTQFVKH